MKQGYFITGTDTGVGKTWATVALLNFFKQQGHCVAAMKPVASGCEWRDDSWQNDDALLLQAHSSMPLPYALINPYAYEMPVSPHLAGSDNPVDLAVILANFAELKSLADVVLVEGAGGWFAPINATLDICGLAKAMQLPVIITVGIRLGCINHALLTHQAIAAAQLPCAGWLAVCNDATMLLPEANISTIKAKLPVPLLGVLPYQAQADFAALGRCLLGLDVVL